MLLFYGAFLAYNLLTETIQINAGSIPNGPIGGTPWRKGKTWSRVLDTWAWTFATNVRIGGVGMLALLTAPLASALFWYHIYLIWAGMTTNETSKWADWRDDITDGLVFRSDRPSASPATREAVMDIEPFVKWPITTKQQLVSSRDGQPPRNQPPTMPMNHNPSTTGGVVSQPDGWKRVRNLNEIDNLYDLGFLDNLKDIFQHASQFD